jgi:hypothetical protein
MQVDSFDIDVTETLLEVSHIPTTRQQDRQPAFPFVSTDAQAATVTADQPTAAEPESDARQEAEPAAKVNLSAAFREWAAVSDMMDDLQDQMTVLAGRRSDVLKAILESHGSGPFKFRGMELLIAKNKNGLGYCVRKMAKSPTVVD